MFTTTRWVVRGRVWRPSTSSSDRFSCDVTLVEEETIEAMKRRTPPVDPGSSARRNIVVRGCTLSQLVGHTFRIGDVTLRGLAPRNSGDASESAQQVAPLESTEQAARCLVLPRADLRADVLTEGIISVGDRIEVMSRSYGGGATVRQGVTQSSRCGEVARRRSEVLWTTHCAPASSRPGW